LISPHFVADARPLDLDDVSASFGKQQAGQRPGQQGAEIEYANAGKRQHGRSTFQMAADHKPLNVVAAFVDFCHAYGAVDSLDSIILHVTVAAERLDRVRADALRRLAREQLGHRCLTEARPADAAQNGRMQNELACGLDSGRHLGQTESDRLVLDDGLSEALPLLRVGESDLICRARNADRLCGNADTCRSNERSLTSRLHRAL
jgi:hypothetical protein